MRASVPIIPTLAYYASFPIFAVLSFSLNCYCLLAGWLPGTPAIERFFQRRVHWHFAVFFRWLRFSGLVPVRYEGFERWRAGSTGSPQAGTPGLVVVANHPGLMDIGLLLARVPEAVCIFKGTIGRNPLFSATVRRAGYIASDGGHHLLRDAAAKIAAGHTLVIFPEGTRTRGDGLNPLKPGFAAIARMARAPIQLIRITYDSHLLKKDGRSWWRVPRLPVPITVSLGPCLPPPGAETAATVAEIEAWFRRSPEPARAPAALRHPAPVRARA